MPNQEADDDLKQQNDGAATSGSNANANSTGGLSFGNSAGLDSVFFFFFFK